MLPSSPPQVDILENGRSGSVVYRDSIDTLTFTWEFGGEDVVAIIQVQDTVAWKNRPTWSAVRREQVLRFVADALIRQKSPTSHAEIDTKRERSYCVRDRIPRLVRNRRLPSFTDMRD